MRAPRQTGADESELGELKSNLAHGRTGARSREQPLARHTVVAHQPAPLEVRESEEDRVEGQLQSGSGTLRGEPAEEMVGCQLTVVERHGIRCGHWETSLLAELRPRDHGERRSVRRRDDGARLAAGDAGVGHFTIRRVGERDLLVAVEVPASALVRPVGERLGTWMSRGVGVAAVTGTKGCLRPRRLTGGRAADAGSRERLRAPPVAVLVRVDREAMTGSAVSVSYAGLGAGQQAG